MDSSESELGILDLIQVFVETLDKCFENVCELDLIFHMDKVHYILNELVMGGMVLETNMTEILTRVEEQNKIEKEEVSNKNNFCTSKWYFSSLMGVTGDETFQLVRSIFSFHVDMFFLLGEPKACLII